MAAELIEQKKKKDMLDFKQDDYVSAIKYSIVFGILQYAALLIFGYAAFLLELVYLMLFVSLWLMTLGVSASADKKRDISKHYKRS